MNMILKIVLPKVLYYFCYALPYLKKLLIFILIVILLMPISRSMPRASFEGNNKKLCTFKKEETCKLDIIETIRFNERYIEYKQDEEAWSDIPYWEGTIKTSGCGPTAISIIASGYGLEETPYTISEYMQKEYGFTNYSSLSDTLKNKLNLDNTIYTINSNTDIEKQAQIIEETLKNGKPVIVSVSAGSDNKYTSTSHIVCLISTDNGYVYVSNPNSKKENGWICVYRFMEYVRYYITIN